MQKTRPRITVVIFAAIWLGVGIVAVLQSYIFAAIDGRPENFGSLVGLQIAPWVVWAFLTPVVLFLGRRVPILKARWTVWLGFHLLMGVLMAVIQTAAAVALTHFFIDSTSQLLALFSWILRSRLVVFILIYFAILGSGLAIDYYHKFRERELVASQLEAQLAGARLEALRMQLHPHFLFNTLQAVAVLIEEDPEAAKSIVTKLGDFLRHTIDATSVQEVPLTEELEFLRLYLDIEQTRFQGRLSVEYGVSERTLRAEVPSFILQPLVENAIKHGVSKHAGPARIEIAARRAGDELVLSVEDGGRRGGRVPPVTSWKDGVGLRNTKQRLLRLYGDAGVLQPEVVDSGVRITIRMPFRSMPEPAPEVGATGEPRPSTAAPLDAAVAAHPAAMPSTDPSAAHG